MFIYNSFKRFLIILIFLIISGCSVVTLSYNRLPFLALLELDSVFNLNDEQKKLVRPKLPTHVTLAQWFGSGYLEGQFEFRTCVFFIFFFNYYYSYLYSLLR